MINNVSNVPFYLNWTFWSFVVAFTALLLSQLPKVHVWFKGRKLHLEIHNRISVSHWLGLPNINLYLGLNNKGRSKIKIKSIILNLSHENKNVIILQCNSFFETTSSQTANLFFPFELLPEHAWNHNCWCTTELDRNTEQKIRKSISNLEMNILSKFQNKKDSNELIEADKELVEPLITFKETAFKWEQGEYFVEIKLTTEPQINISKNFRFTLYEADINELNAYANDYKYGMPYSRQKNVGINIPISENSH